jgi:hypothetical protein
MLPHCAFLPRLLLPTQQLGTILDQLTEEGVLNQYQPEDLEMLAADMDIDGT